MRRTARALAAEAGEEIFDKIMGGADDQNVEEIPELNESREQDHGDEDDDGRVNEFLVFLKALDFRVGFPRPARFVELAFYFAQEIGDFRKHDGIGLRTGGGGMARKVGLEPTTNGFGDRYSTN